MMHATEPRREQLLKELTGGSAGQTELAALSETIKSSLRYTNTIAQDMKKTGKVLRNVEERGRYLLVDAEIIRTNYDVSRSIGMLAAAGYTVFIQKYEVLATRKAWSEFVRAYQLEALEATKRVIPLSSEGVLAQAEMTREARRKLNPEDVSSRLCLSASQAGRCLWPEDSRASRGARLENESNPGGRGIVISP